MPVAKTRAVALKRLGRSAVTKIIPTEAYNILNDGTRTHAELTNIENAKSKELIKTKIYAIHHIAKKSLRFANKYDPDPNTTIQISATVRVQFQSYTPEV